MSTPGRLACTQYTSAKKVTITYSGYGIGTYAGDEDKHPLPSCLVMSRENTVHTPSNYTNIESSANRYSRKRKQTLPESRQRHLSVSLTEQGQRRHSSRAAPRQTRAPALPTPAKHTRIVTVHIIHESQDDGNTHERAITSKTKACWANSDNTCP